jgi:hypothetical protein
MSHDLQFSIEGEPEPNWEGNMTSSMPPSAASSSSVVAALQNSSHPVACVFHCLFKLLAILLYIFGGWFSGDGHGGVSGSHFITVTVICILLLAADFWVVKNITGRLLVGLRWWNQVDGETTKWIFESKNESAKNKFDQSVFWTVLYVTPLIWSVLFLWGLLKFQLGWLLTVCMGGSLSVANVYGYYKCSSDQKAKFTQMIQQGSPSGSAQQFVRHVVGCGSQCPPSCTAAAAAAAANLRIAKSRYIHSTTTVRGLVWSTVVCLGDSNPIHYII